MSVIGQDQHRCTVLFVSCLAFLPTQTRSKILYYSLKGTKLDQAWKKVLEQHPELPEWFRNHFSFDPLYMNFSGEMRVCLLAQGPSDLLVHREMDRVVIDIGIREAIQMTARLGVRPDTLRSVASSLNRLLAAE